MVIDIELQNWLFQSDCEKSSTIKYLNIGSCFAIMKSLGNKTLFEKRIIMKYSKFMAVGIFCCCSLIPDLRLNSHGRLPSLFPSLSNNNGGFARNFKLENMSHPLHHMMSVTFFPGKGTVILKNLSCSLVGQKFIFVYRFYIVIAWGGYFFNCFGLGFFHFCFLVLWDRVCLHKSGYPVFLIIYQADLELTQIHVALCPKCWD